MVPTRRLRSASVMTRLGKGALWPAPARRPQAAGRVLTQRWMHDHHSRNHIIIGRGDIRICHRRSTLVGARTGVVSGSARCYSRANESDMLFGALMGRFFLMALGPAIRGAFLCSLQ